jgi:uncharacterized protein YdcH (DUF465 family)
MENSDRELLKRAMQSDTRLRRLYDRHLSLESKLNRMGTMTFLTPSEQMEKQRLKKVKLHGVDEMMLLLQEHR